MTVSRFFQEAADELMVPQRHTVFAGLAPLPCSSQFAVGCGVAVKFIPRTTEAPKEILTRMRITGFVLKTATMLVLFNTASFASGRDSGRGVFTLGRFDDSSQEFAPGSPSGLVRVLATGAHGSQGWYSFQPIVQTDAQGNPTISSAPRSIVFSIEGKPVSTYMVRVGLLIEHASVPSLHVGLNGHEGTFYLDPKLDSNIGDGGAVSFPSFSWAIVSFEVPGDFLHSGTNTISFSATAQQKGRKSRTQDSTTMQSRWSKGSRPTMAKPTYESSQRSSIASLVAIWRKKWM